jgi:hypothetical protein
VKFIPFLFLAFALVAEPCFADHLVLSFGPTLNGNTNPKHASVGYEFPLSSAGEAVLMPECRGIFSEGFNGACELVLSARVETQSGLFMRLGAGPAWYFREDDRVSSHFNFNLQGAIGLTASGLDLGIAYIHYSNAGLWGPNLGRDFLGVVIELHVGESPRPDKS